ncbi:MAG: glutamyl-tRNA reductase [Armatimonadota bacterium]|jgi:glutamyl-tRNA reductase
MHIEAVGLSHKTAPVEMRERIAFSEQRVREVLPVLTDLPGVAEGTILSTCNRTELYACLADGYHQHDGMAEMLCRYYDGPEEALRPRLYMREDADAVHHVFRVAAGIDSMVVGEGEILGQVRRAREAAQEGGALGGALSRMLREAIGTGKRVRTETAIGEGAVSVASVAVSLAGSIFGDLADTTVLVLGAGETAELTLKHLVGSGVRAVVVSNRTHERAEALAAAYGGDAIRFDGFSVRLPDADIVICSTAAPHPIVQPEVVAAAMRERKGAPLFFIDIAVPRDVDAAVAQLDSVFLYDIDDLQGVVAENLAARQAEVDRAEEIVRRDAEGFLKWIRQQPITPTLVALKEHVHALVQAELDGVCGKLSSERDRELAARLARSIANKILATPFKELKRAAERNSHDAMAEHVRRLFGLENGEER